MPRNAVDADGVDLGTFRVREVERAHAVQELVPGLSLAVRHKVYRLQVRRAERLRYGVQHAAAAARADGLGESHRVLDRLPRAPRELRLERMVAVRECHHVEVLRGAEELLDHRKVHGRFDVLDVGLHGPRGVQHDRHMLFGDGAEDGASNNDGDRPAVRLEGELLRHVLGCPPGRLDLEEVRLKQVQGGGCKAPAVGRHAHLPRPAHGGAAAERGREQEGATGGRLAVRRNEAHLDVHGLGLHREVHPGPPAAVADLEVELRGDEGRVLTGLQLHDVAPRRQLAGDHADVAAHAAGQHPRASLLGDLEGAAADRLVAARPQHDLAGEAQPLHVDAVELRELRVLHLEVLREGRHGQVLLRRAGPVRSQGCIVRGDVDAAAKPSSSAAVGLCHDRDGVAWLALRLQTKGESRERPVQVVDDEESALLLHGRCDGELQRAEAWGHREDVRRQLVVVALLLARKPVPAGEE
mmetsp:Transcript_106654/g.332561  ORF Transcript_106654/g.332561 Transcript_106654/m.332561 type:complete len:469 (+) Transcript_106654:394-1800(+)